MATRDYIKHIVSTSEPAGANVGDEYYNPSTNKLFKRLAVSGTSVQYRELQPAIAFQASGTTVTTAPSQVNFPGASVTFDSTTGTLNISASGIPGGSNTHIQFNNAGGFGGSSNLTWNNATQTLTITGFTSSNQIRALGGLNATSWTTTGPIFNTSGSLTDTSGSGGTVALRVGSSINASSWASSVATTVTNAASFYVESPTAGANTTLSNTYGVYNAGNMYVGGTLVAAGSGGILLGSSRVVDWKNTTAQWSLSGGGLITWTGSAVLWGTRVIAIPVESTEMGSAGYFDINCPTSGTVVYYNSLGATTTLTCTAAGIPLASWEALYYEVTEGQGSTSDQTKFRVVNYQNTTWRPGPGWLLLAAVNGDGNNVGHLKWIPGQVNLPTTGSTVTYNTGTGAASWLTSSGITSVSVASANGLAGTSSGGTTPSLTLSTTITGVLKGNGTAISAAVAGTDFLAPSSTFNLGTTSITLNRASASQSLTGISIDGNAGTATAANWLRQTDATTVLTPGQSITSSGARGTALAPNTYSYGIFSEFKNSSLFSFTGTYTGLITYAPWQGTTASTGDPSYQLAFHPNAANATTNPRLKFRAGIDTTWGSWGEISHTGVTDLNIRHNSIGVNTAASGTAGTLALSTAGTAITVSVTSGTDRYFINCTGAQNSFSVYENSNTPYIDSWSSMAFRANQKGGTGGSITFSGGTVNVLNQLLDVTAATPATTNAIRAKSNIAWLSPDNTRTITSKMLNAGTLSFEGSVGQLFSITNSMTGTIFSVNDVSGVPSIEVLDTGVIRLAQYAGFVAFGVSSGLTATGSTQGTALLLTRPINDVTTVAASTGVVLPAATPGMRILIRNSGANTLKVYPASGAQVNTLGTNVGFDLSTATLLEFIAFSTTQWYTLNTTYA